MDEKEALTTISLDLTTQNIGSIFFNQPKEVEFIFINTGKYPLLIYEVRASCECTVPEWSQKPIKPGRSGMIKVIYNADRFGQFNKSINVFANTQNNPTILRFHGEVIEVINSPLIE